MDEIQGRQNCALKRGLTPLQNELGIYVCGGRGRHSRRTHDELSLLGEEVGLDAEGLTRASRLVAKVDSAAKLAAIIGIRKSSP